MRVALCVALLSASAFAQAPETRWALVVGENTGFNDEDVLRYAEEDAKKVLKTLEAVGGVTPEHAVSVLGTNADKLRETFKAFSERLEQEASPNDVLFVYVSSHAGDGELHLAGSKLPLDELTQFVKKVKPGVAVLVLDACRSGFVTRTKGLKPVPTQVKVDAGDLEGRVFISASGSDEYAQESDEIKGSYFTHHWVTGLRGAADTSCDGKVTLDEAYQWAYGRTLESTFGTQGGIQRPAFKVDLHGRGELVLTEPATARARLTLGASAAGHWLVVAAQSGTVIADLEKPPGTVELAVPPGAYRVRLRTEDGYFERQVEVAAAGGVVRIDDFDGAPFTRVAAKGVVASELWLSAGMALSSPLVDNTGLGMGAAARLERDAALFGFIDTLAVMAAFRDVQTLQRAPWSQQEAELRVGAGHRFQRGRISAQLALELGAVAVFQHDVPASNNRNGLEPVAMVTVEGRVRVVGPVHAYLLVEGGGALVKEDSASSIRAAPRLTGSAGLGFTF